MGCCLAWSWDEIDLVQIVTNNEQIGVHLVIDVCLKSNKFEFKWWGNDLSRICVVFLYCELCS